MLNISKNGNSKYEIRIRLWVAAITLVILLFTTFASMVGAYYKLNARVDERHIIDQTITEDIKAIKATQGEWIAALHKIEVHLGKIEVKLEMIWPPEE